MSNAHFQFQQFTVRQDRCAMKVCTDACLFGAWLTTFADGSRRAIDIGAGTGLLSLMVAQQTAAMIDAVEIDAETALQAAENFAASPWRDRLKVIQMPVQEFAAGKLSATYDLVISNPPFFSEDLKSPDSKRNLALHSAALTFDELVSCALRLLSPDGVFAVLVPVQRSAEIEKIASANGLMMQVRTMVRQSPGHFYFRAMYLFRRRLNGSPVTSSVTIKEESGRYTPEFSLLLNEFYLHHYALT